TSRWEQRARSVSWQAWQHRHRNVNGAARRLMARLILRSVSASLAVQVSIGFPASSKCLTPEHSGTNKVSVQRRRRVLMRRVITLFHRFLFQLFLTAQTYRRLQTAILLAS